MKYTIKIRACDHSGISAEERISRAMGFERTLSRECLINIFADGMRVFGGNFMSRRSAEIVARRINDRCVFGGTPVAVVAVVAAVIPAAE